MQSRAPSSVSGTHSSMRRLHQTRAAGLHPPTGSMQKATETSAERRARPRRRAACAGHAASTRRLCSEGARGYISREISGPARGQAERKYSRRKHEAHTGRRGSGGVEEIWADGRARRELLVRF
jgi:hypothetical protein